MIWEEIKGEILTYNGAESEDLLHDRDMYVQDGHLREMVSLEACIDYGPIELGDKVFLYSGQTYILKGVNRKQSDTTQIRRTKMPRYIRKINYVDAVRWTGDNRIEIDEFTQSNPGEIFWDFIDGISIKTPNGRVTAKKGDWICKDMMGKLYPCSDDVFRQTYHVGDGD